MDNIIHSIPSTVGSTASVPREMVPASGGAAPPVEAGSVQSLKEAAGLSVEKLAPTFGKAPKLDASPLSVQSAEEGAVADQKMAVAVQQVSSYLQLADTNLELRVDKESGNQTVVSIYDGEDGSLLRQYPTEEMLEIARKITEQMSEFRNSLINGGAAPSVRGLFTNAVV